ncbi:acyltransferase family protein [Occallatibacter savannae]|uniref:acyltransferase family protein n=1 Tax=Occallatibacter savannae TaxID=1002691 RepID=UPI000D6924EC|nr:acyltransferase family protein [Occallatibacter savannae]
MLATSSPVKQNRIAALDFTKGALVLFMVLYHWVNYFIGLEWPYYPYLRFLSPSFIFITGFMVSSVYLSRQRVESFDITKRLVTRGLKILLIFVLLNVGRILALPVLSPGSSAFRQVDEQSIVAAFLTGNFTTKIVSFSILVPIGYLLVFSGLLIPLFRRFRWTSYVVFALFFLAASGLELMELPSMNLEILSIGMMGVVMGAIPMEKINKAVSHWFAIGIAYALYTVAITRYGVPFLLQIAGTFLTLIVLYAIGLFSSEKSRVRGTIDLLGKYSLFGYIFQIVILQLLAALFRHRGPDAYVLAGTFFGAFVLTIAGVEVLDRARHAAAGIDRAYKLVFN